MTIDEQKARGPVARPKHGRHGTAQARHGPEDTGPGLGTARVPGRAWAARQARRVARHGPQLVEGTVEARYLIYNYNYIYLYMNL